MVEFNEEKQRLRAHFSALRGELKTPEKDAKICANVLELSGASFFVYHSFGSEAATHVIIAALLKRGKTVCLPRVEGGEMKAVRYCGGELEKGAFGIKQPRGGEDFLCEVALVPLLAVDGAGNRLGYGGGYYDRYFKTHENILRVGLCYKGQATNKLPACPHDIPLHAVVTEEGVTFF